MLPAWNARGSIRTVPANHSIGPGSEGCEPLFGIFMIFSHLDDFSVGERFIPDRYLRMRLFQYNPAIPIAVEQSSAILA
ncbi:hypothetical protein JWG42_16370 [Desulfoprunum benzoelyticum]|uniref:Uncharacterized protein n=1 Tax=Desulfoprunum benzoelyticum TaxID=1506996 RepID=A0A840V6X6_9BACT|nr:hypothetical protein [Desulfoprunum benzoelyticum]MBB5349690.1 hypothetical protein [Desulfoprunum benzoelyticum]MBM9531734.1 hypothetical protein [Desulfoprunum benzoelyticum]